MIAHDTGPAWPALPLAAWQQTYTTLRLEAQIVAKIMGRLAPPQDEWWHVALRPRARGLASGLLPCHGGTLELVFDFVDHNLYVLSSHGDVKAVPLLTRPVAEFYAELFAVLRSLGVLIAIDTRAEEGVSLLPLDSDREHAAYDREAVERWWTAVMSVYRVFQIHRSSFRGRASPILHFAESFDLSYVRYSGRRLPAEGNGSSAEQIAAGFWPGGGVIDGAAFYSYTSPPPSGLAETAVSPAAARYDTAMGEFILMYDDVRASASPEAVVLAFLQSTYEAGARAADWDRAALEVESTGS